MSNRKLEINPEQVQKLAAIGCTDKEIAEIVGCSHDTLTRRFKDMLIAGRATGKASLRRKQWEVALSGNVTMLIWLGKQQLGQTDKQEVKSETTERVIKFNWGGVNHLQEETTESIDAETD
jgi:hypothetical protein